MTKNRIILFDKNCGFCRRRINEWRRLTQKNVTYKAVSNLNKITLITPNLTIYTGARAIFEILSPYSNLCRLFLRLYKYKFFGGFFELAYNVISYNRLLLSKIW